MLPICWEISATASSTSSSPTPFSSATSSTASAALRSSGGGSEPVVVVVVVVPVVVVAVVEVLVDEDDLYLAAVVGLDVQVPRTPTILRGGRIPKGVDQEHEPYRHQGCKNENVTSDRQNRVVRPVPHCPTSKQKLHCS